MFERPALGAGDAFQCAEALLASITAERRAVAERFVHLADWADFQGPGFELADNDPDPAPVPAVRREPGQLGGEGTPPVSAKGITELGLLLGTGTWSAQKLLADVLDLKFRLHAHWEAVLTGRLDGWKAREVARTTRRLTYDQARTVDAQVIDAVLNTPWGRARNTVEAAVIAADPAAHQARLAAEENKRYVSTRRRTNPAGLRTLVARGTAGDIARLEAMISHLADRMATAGDPDPLDVRRAKAHAMLANPALTCVYLATQHHTTPDTSTAAPTDNASGTVGKIDPPVDSGPELDAEAAQAEPDPDADVDPDPDPEPEPEPEEASTPSAVELAIAFGHVLKQLGAKALDRLRPRSILYVHCSEEAVRGIPGTGVARVEDPVAGGPISTDQMRQWLGHDRITVKPVLDPTDLEPVDDYAIPTGHREALRLLMPYESFPYGTLPTAQADGDHSKRYVSPDRGGPPGQTGLHNLGPLGRRHHLVKTFDGFTVHQIAIGLYFWRTPLGYWYRVDHHGTHPLGRLAEPPAVVTAAERYDRPAMTPAERHTHEFLLRKLAA